MTLARPPLLRTALHLLLALAMLLQGSAVMAMHSTAPEDVPPCHAAALAGDDADAAPLGELCRWACAQAFGVQLPVVAIVAQPMLSPPPKPLRLPALPWHHATPLRPPIG